MIKVVTPEETYFPHISDKYWFKDEKAIKIFLAGTIDDGNSDDWQYSLISNLLMYNLNENDDSDFDNDFSIGDLIIYSPRRKNWDPNSSNEEIIKQIEWEQEKLDDSDLIIMYLKDDSKSPISLLELGLYGPQGKMIVFCTDKFYRYNNVKCTCKKYGIELFESNNLKYVVDRIAMIYDEIYPIKCK